MKKFALIVALGSMLVSLPAFAMDVMLGGKAGYFMWRPYFKDVKTSFFPDIEIGTGALYGPALSLIFDENVSFSGVALFGSQQAHWDQNNVLDSNGRYRCGTFFIESDRIDVDTAVSYRLSDGFKLFAGYKYQRVLSIMKYTELTTIDLNDNDLSAFKESDEITFAQHGPALGIGYSLPFGGNMFFSANVSAIYMWGNAKAIQNAVHYDGTIGFLPGHIKKDFTLMDTDTTSFGLNIEPAFGVRVNEKLVLTLGVRYQWLHVKIDEIPDVPKNGMDDHLAGAFMSILFVF